MANLSTLPLGLHDVLCSAPSGGVDLEDSVWRTKRPEAVQQLGSLQLL